MDGTSKMYKIVDLFAGIGGLSYGFKENGFKLVFANDFDKDCNNTYNKNFPDDLYILEPIENIDIKYLQRYFSITPKVDIMCGGIPCQPFSMSGFRNRKKLKDQYDGRTYLYKHFLRVAKILEPKILLIENVRGIMSLKGGAIFEDILKSIEKLGYLVDVKVVNSADYGAPQTRKRTIILANNIGVDNIFPDHSHNPTNYNTVKDIFLSKKAPNHEPKYFDGINLERMKLVKPGKNWKSLPKKYQTKSQHSGAYGRMHPNQPSRTITTRFDTPSVGFVTVPHENRTLTVREGARIQMIPDDFIITGNKMSQFRQIGNAVPFNLSKHFSNTVKKMLENES